MEFDLKKNHFVLKTTDILNSNTIGDFPVSNANGSINATRTSITWNAISIKDILKEMYDDYELFNITLTMVVFPPTATTAYGITVEDRTIHFGMTGLDWVFTNYNVTTRNTSTESILSSIIFFQAGAAINLAQNPNLTFRKCNTTDITIKLYTIDGILPDMNAATIYPQMSFYFTITPVI
jgi:hypothetical protein